MRLDVEESESSPSSSPAPANPLARALELTRALEAALGEYAVTAGDGSSVFRVRLARAQALGLVDLMEELALEPPTSRPPPATIRSGIFPAASAHGDSLETSDVASEDATLKTCA
jgi:hypothetical protein